MPMLLYQTVPGSVDRGFEHQFKLRQFKSGWIIQTFEFTLSTVVLLRVRESDQRRTLKPEGNINIVSFQFPLTSNRPGIAEKHQATSGTHYAILLRMFYDPYRLLSPFPMTVLMQAHIRQSVAYRKKQDLLYDPGSESDTYRLLPQSH
ncbi:hypothetical protein BT96DRAFT_936877 [Gymnopus androsaceus JB14]|uniref:Uncharacterized protein n=1 Tax=Gymnopus androsaceus JB14 TaxID=1447944 RepID=A0A6A4I0T4_9AGAR|nr:hypothetical protein BT96DRAFT_936877 [Gymnopus androsaceus JB14]